MFIEPREFIDFLFNDSSNDHLSVENTDDDNIEITDNQNCDNELPDTRNHVSVEPMDVTSTEVSTEPSTSSGNARKDEEKIKRPTKKKPIRTLAQLLRKPKVTRVKKVTRKETAKLTKLLSLVSMIALLLSILGGISATPMICHKRSESKLIRFEQDNKSCKQIANLLEHHPQYMKLSIYRPDPDSFQFLAHRCIKMRPTQRYRTDFLGYPLEEKPKQLTIPTTIEDCQEMIRYRKCEFGSLLGQEGQSHTNNHLEIKQSWWNFGWQNSEAENCFLAKFPLTGKPGSDTINSPIDDVTKCKYLDGHCKLENGAILLWEIKRNVNSLYDERTCSYKLYKKENGSFAKGIWLSESRTKP